MLEVKKINKSYKTGDFVQHALKDVSIKFRKNEFVSILGASGSGKTTLLNIIGGLDRYDSGDLIINNTSTKKFKNIDWDRYRNNCIGFIFQSYNLIPHITILDNVEMGMTLSGVSAKVRHKKAKDALKKVGLLEHAHKKPGQLSGGQMQRVAIARALVNDPDIVLADEPTGALDSKTSVQIMDLIKDIAKDKLVIMVTHNADLAREYSTRIIEFQDGKKVSDSNPIKDSESEESHINIRKTAMSFMTALKLSFNNIKTKKGRTLLTAFASSIGIIGIGLILSLSNGFKIEVDEFERDSLSQAPIIISTQAMNITEETMNNYVNSDLEEYPSEEKVYVQDDVLETMVHTNKFSQEYMDYLDGIDKKDLSGVAYQTATGFNLVNKSTSGYNLVSGANYWTLIPKNPNSGVAGIIQNNYDILAGEVNDSEAGLILQVDSRNQVFASTLKALGLEGESVSFEDIMNAEIKLVLNDEYYQEYRGMFIPSMDLKKLYESENSITIKVQAIIRGKEDKSIITAGSGLGYTNALTELVIEKNKNSKIVEAQRNSEYNILTNQPFEEGSLTNTKDIMLSYLGAESLPSVIYLYPTDFDSKENITDYLDEYNKNKSDEDTIQYTDMASMISSLSGNIMDAITVVLVAFSSISLVVSSIMIAIITYISVLERTKEIGILRALGARGKDIKRVFNAETFIIGLCSGVLGIVIAYILTIPTNIVIENLSGLAGVAKLNIVHAIILVIINVILTIIGGYIPARMASKRDAVVALRTE